MNPGATDLAPEAGSSLLYHYTSYASFLEILKSGKLWATAMQYLSDFQELLHAVAMLRLLIREPCEAAGIRYWEEEIRLLEERIAQFPRVRIFQFSFSEDPDLLSQWRAYCPNGGVAFGIPLVALEILGRAEQLRLVRCLYGRSEQAQTLNPAADRFVEILKAGEEARVDASMTVEHWKFRYDDWAQAFIAAAANVKNQSFREEREWRLISQPVAVDDGRLGCHVHGGSLIPHLEIPFKEMAGIARVIVGPHVHADLMRAAVSTATRAYGQKNCTVLVSRIPYRPL